MGTKNKARAPGTKHKNTGYSQLDIMDEMMVRANLVFDRVTEELSGYVDLGDPDTNYTALQKVYYIASHAVYYIVSSIRSICADLNFSLEHFTTSSVTAAQTLPLLPLLYAFWNLQVI